MGIGTGGTLLKADRIGLVIVLASLTAVAAIIWLVFGFQQEHRVNNIRSQGVSLVRTLSAVPQDQLIPGGEQQGIMQVLRHSARDNGFAYLSVVDREGRPINEVAAVGLIVPIAELPTEPASWLGERQLTLVADQRRIIEFHAPLVVDGDLSGFVRLGYLYPSPGLDMSQLPFLATVALPVFLLAPLFYLLLRHEVRPIRAANRQINQLMEDQALREVQVTASGELGEMLRGLNNFVGFVNSRIQDLEQDQQRLVTSAKLLTYRKNRVETVLETLPEAVLILDESGTITFANQKMAALFGVTQDVVLDQPPQSWCDNPDVLQLLSKYQATGKGRNFTDTLRFNIDSALDRSIATKTYPLFSPNKGSSSIGTLIIFRDETKEALARQARTDFVSHLSHELKSPLNVLGMYSESLLSEVGKTEEFRVEAANVIAEEVERLSSLINGLLNVTQIESGSLTPDRSLVKLGDLASAAFEEAKSSAKGRDFKFELDIPKEMNPVMLDKDLIRIAVTNLLSNAVKYSGDGGQVRLAIEETEDAIQIRVADSGIGVSEAEAVRIFDKFYRSDDERVQSVGGHGLGLALAKQIVELHHGTLSLNRDREQGAEFIINLWKETTAVRQAI